MHKRAESSYLKRLRSSEEDTTDPIPLLLLTCCGCTPSVKQVPTRGVFGVTKPFMTNGLIRVRLSDAVTSWANILCEENAITILVKVDDWAPLYADLKKFANDPRASSSVLYEALGSNSDAFELFQRTLRRALYEDACLEVDPASLVPVGCSYIVIDSIASCSKVVACQDDAPDSASTNWFNAFFELQCGEAHPQTSGLMRYYETTTPAVRMVLQHRPIPNSPSNSSTHRLNTAPDSMDAIRRLFMHKIPATITSDASGATVLCDNEAASTHDCGDVPLGVPTETHSDDGGVDACICGLLLSAWETRLFVMGNKPRSINDLIQCFEPRPAIIVKQRSWLLFHHARPNKPMTLTASQARYILNRHSTVVLFDQAANTCARYVNGAHYRLSNARANEVISLLSDSSPAPAIDTRPTKRLRELLKS
jgi:hypothetical protein